MKKKILVTRKLLRSNEERASELWDAKLNLNDEVYSQKKLIELSQSCDGILSSLTDKIDEKVIINLPSSISLSPYMISSSVSLSLLGTISMGSISPDYIIAYLRIQISNKFL